MTGFAPAIAKSRQDDVLILSIQVPEIRQYEVSQQVSRELTEAIGDELNPRVVVDLSHVEYMSSVGYLPFVGLRSKVLNANGVLVLCNFSDSIKEMFETARLLVNSRSPSAPFLVANTVEAAIALVKVSNP